MHMMLFAVGGPLPMQPGLDRQVLSCQVVH